jgi:protein-L-isoaspartate(D-aspartate) O-methyltransferase
MKPVNFTRLTYNLVFLYNIHMTVNAIKFPWFFFIGLLISVGACQSSPTPTEAIPTTITSIPTIEPSRTPTQIPPTETPSTIEFEAARERMVADQIAARGINDQTVLAAMRNIPRHQFVPDDMVPLAYQDHPLPIGFGQTISQPFIVALMTQTLNPQPGQKILEIGTGSGYQAAVLAELGVEVYTVEIIPELAQPAAERLQALGYTNVHTLTADGYFGWEEFAPFDAIIVTAAPDHLPQPLANQLAEGGRLVIPIGPVGFLQSLWLYEKIEGDLFATNLGGVRFVPLTGEH